MRVRYHGAHAGVDVVMPDGRPDVTVQHGETLETTPDHAAALLEQPANWEPVKPTKADQKHDEKEGDS